MRKLIMENQNRIVKIPGYIKYFFILSGIVLTLYIIIIGQFLFKPLLSALIIAVILKPLISYLENKVRSRTLSVAIIVAGLFIVVSALLLFIFSQAQNITKDTDKLAQGFELVLDSVQNWLQSTFGFSPDKQVSLLKNNALDFLKKFTAFIPQFLLATADFFAEFFLFLIALCFFLYHRQFLINFLFQLSRDSQHHKINTILNSIQNINKKYIFGILLVILITGILNTAGLLILGIDHAIFFGVVAGILTIIPYIGIVTGSLLPVLYAIATTHSLWYPLGVIFVFSFVQFLEGNFITPKIVGHQVSLNPLASLLALFFAGKFLGILGVILALPCLAIIKVIFDQLDSLKPYGYLIGNAEKK